MARLLKKRRAKKQAEELAKKTALIELRDRNRAKREAKLKAIQAAAKAKPAGISGLASADEIAKKQAEMKKFKKESEAAKIRTKRGKANLRSRASVGFGEAYDRVEADGTVRKVIKTKQNKDIQPKPRMQQSASNVKSQNKKTPSDNSQFNKKFAEEREKQGPGGEFAFKGKKYSTNLKEEENNMAKHGSALAIMIAPVKTKTKKMKAVKKAPGGASMKKMKMMKKGGKLKMVKGPDGKMVPFYAADGKGKMAKGGRMGSKEMMESMKKDDKMLKHGGKVKGKMMYGASMKKAMYGAKMKKKAMYGAKMKK